MDKDRFNALLADLDQITDADIKSLNQLRKQYPYFQNQYVMMAKALKDREHPKADAFVKKAALYVADQGLLKGIINGTHSFVTTAVAEEMASEPAPESAKAEETSTVEPIAEVVETVEEAKEKAVEIQSAALAEEEVKEVETAEPAEETKAESASESTPEPEPIVKAEEETAKAAEPEVVASPPPEQDETVEANETEAVETAESEEESAPEVVATKATDGSEDMISELEKDLAEIKAKKRLLAKMLEQSETKEKAKAPSAQKKTTKRSKKNQSELIEKFIKNEPQMDKQKLVSDENSPAQVDLASKNLKSTDNFYTETLAKLMVKQKKYKKAIEIYEKLGLKFPEKRAYFASQIEKVKNKSNV